MARDLKPTGGGRDAACACRPMSSRDGGSFSTCMGSTNTPSRLWCLPWSSPTPECSIPRRTSTVSRSAEPTWPPPTPHRASRPGMGLGCERLAHSGTAGAMAGGTGTGITATSDRTRLGLRSPTLHPHPRGAGSPTGRDPAASPHPKPIHGCRCAAASTWSCFPEVSHWRTLDSAATCSVVSGVHHGGERHAVSAVE